MKMTDGLFHKVFDEIGEEYPTLEKEHWIVDIGAAKMADTPEVFDVIVMPNLYGDILSDVSAQIAGSVGLAAVQMLVHMGEGKTAQKIHNAWLKTMEDGIHTYDLYREGISKQKVGTKEFAIALSKRLGEEPSKLQKAQYSDEAPLDLRYERKDIRLPKKELIGVDIFVQEDNRDPELLAERLKAAIRNLPLSLQMITNRGVKVYPQGMKETFKTDHWRCRLVAKDGGISNHAVI